MTLTQINKAGLDELALDHVFTIGASGSSAYTFQGEGLNGTVNNPTLYLTRGKTYRFENGSGGHPIRIQSTSGASGTAYNTGVTNNAGSGTVIVEVQHDAPDVLYYQCTSHAAMNGILYITGALADGGVTTAKIAADAVTGAKIADDAINSEHYTDGSIDTAHIADSQVTTAKIANDAITTAKIANTAIITNKIATSAVTTNRIADQAVTLDKLPHGTSSNDGKFLRANNGADPSFETVSIPAGTTINNNADNRVITGSGTANTLEGEANLTFDGTVLQTQATAPDLRIKSSNAGLGQSDEVGRLSIHTSDPTTPTGAGEVFRLKSFSANANGADYSTELVSRAGSGGGESTIRLGQGAVGAISFSTNPSGSATERMRIDSSGRVLIGTTTQGTGSADDLTIASSANTGITIRSGTSNDGNLFFSDGTSGNDTFRGFIQYEHANNVFRFGTNSSEAMRINSIGNVGIGTTNPGQKLEVRQTNASHAIIACNRPNSDTFAVALGNNSSGQGILSVNNADLIFGRDYSGTFTERMRMRNDGGLCFNGDSSAANALDDYEEGTFTALLQVQSGSPGFSTTTGKYTKIGNIVHVQAEIQWNATNGTGAYPIYIPLPFAVTSCRGAFSIGIVSGLDCDPGHLAILSPEINASYAWLFQYKGDDPAGGHSHMHGSDMRNYASRFFCFAGTYTTT